MHPGAGDFVILTFPQGDRISGTGQGCSRPLTPQLKANKRPLTRFECPKRSIRNPAHPGHSYYTNQKVCINADAKRPVGRCLSVIEIEPVGAFEGEIGRDVKAKRRCSALSPDFRMPVARHPSDSLQPRWRQ